MASPVYARGVAKTLVIAAETDFGVKGTGAGQQLRRTSSDLNLSVQQVQSGEILTSQQVRDQRNGPRSVSGTLSGQLSPASYSALFEGLMRSTFAAVASIASVTDTTSALDGYGNIVVTSGTANFASRFKIGDVLRVNGLTGAAAANNFDDCRVVFVSATQIALGPPVSGVAWTSGQTDTFALPGKKLIIPNAGQTNKSYSFEHWYSDTGRSELFLGCKIVQMAINVPASGFVTIQASVSGRDMQETGTQQYPTAAAQTTTTGLTATTGKIAYNGVTLGYITGMSIQIAASVGADPVSGSNVVPDIFLGTLSVRGSLSCLTTSDSLTADFLNENEVSLSVLLTASPADNAEFMSFNMPRCKLISSTKNDSDKAIMRSYSFVALENTGQFPTSDLTSLMVQDSLTP